MKALKNLIVGPDQVNFMMIRAEKKETQRFGEVRDKGGLCGQRQKDGNVQKDLGEKRYATNKSHVNTG